MLPRAPNASQPRCGPAQIPAEQQGMVRSAYWAFLGFVIAITFNLIGSLVALCAMNGNDGRLTGFFLSAVYWFAGVPGAWILWYMRCPPRPRPDLAPGAMRVALPCLVNKGLFHLSICAEASSTFLCFFSQTCMSSCKWPNGLYIFPNERAECRLYNAAIKDRAFTYAWFFLMFAAHIIFCIWSAVSPPLPLGNAWSHTGFILGVQARGPGTRAPRRSE
jgi:hypothetical protein